jgi:threonine/homoserine/homoserine lactone efflux protein
MLPLLSGTLPYAVAAMLAAPLVPVLSAIIMDRARRPIPSTFFFILGALLLDVPLAAAIVVGVGFVETETGSKIISAWLDVAFGAAFMFLGVKAALERDTEAQHTMQRARAERIAQATPLGLIGAGILVQLFNADALIVMAEGMKGIDDLTPPPPAASEVATVVIFLFIMLVPYHLPIDVYLLWPRRAATIMRPITDWLFRHFRILEVVVGFGFGAIFLLKGGATLIRAL